MGSRLAFRRVRKYCEPMVKNGAAAPARASTRWARIFLAGPLAFACSIAIMGGSLLWIPPGGGGVNHIVLPITLYPAIWTALFFYACFDRNLARGYSIVGGLLALHAALIGIHWAMRWAGAAS
jgi:hypothetical protein